MERAQNLQRRKANNVVFVTLSPAEGLGEERRFLSWPRSMQCGDGYSFLILLNQKHNKEKDLPQFEGCRLDLPCAVTCIFSKFFRIIRIDVNL